MYVLVFDIVFINLTRLLGGLFQGSVFVTLNAKKYLKRSLLLELLIYWSYNLQDSCPIPHFWTRLNISVRNLIVKQNWILEIQQMINALGSEILGIVTMLAESWVDSWSWRGMHSDHCPSAYFLHQSHRPVVATFFEPCIDAIVTTVVDQQAKSRKPIKVGAHSTSYYWICL